MVSELSQDRMVVSKKLIKFWLPVAVWMAFISWMSTDTFSAQNTSRLIEPIIRLLFPTASPQLVSLFHAIVRKAGHIVEYFVLGCLLFRAFRADSSELWNWRWPVYAVAVVALWAVCDEVHQSFVPSRGASIKDVGIDIAGGIMAQVAGFWQFRHKGK